MRYTFSKLSIWGIVIFVIGFFCAIRGIHIQNHLSDVRRSYRENEIKSGCYIEYDITKEQLIGKYYSEPNGTIRYGPYCNANALSSIETYIVAVNEESNYYVPLVIPRQYQKDFHEMIRSDTVFHVCGKFIKSKHNLNYDTIANCTGINNQSEIAQMISVNYQIKIVDFKEEHQLLYKGLLLLTAGLLIVFVTVKKKFVK